ncbi:MAG: hypothetical protein ACK4F9_05345, partial [Brevinematia bacterium]
GLPIIITELKAIKSIFNENSVVYIKSPDANMIAKNIIELIKDKNKRRTIAENSYKDVSNICWSKMKKSYFQIIKHRLSII